MSMICHLTLPVSSRVRISAIVGEGLSSITLSPNLSSSGSRKACLKAPPYAPPPWVISRVEPRCFSSSASISASVAGFSAVHSDIALMVGSGVGGTGVGGSGVGASGSEGSGAAVAAGSGSAASGSEGAVVGVGWSAVVGAAGSGVGVAASPQLAAAKTKTSSIVRKPRAGLRNFILLAVLLASSLIRLPLHLDRKPAFRAHGP